MPSHRWENYVLLRLLPTPYHRGAACETQQNLHRPVNKWPTSRNFTNNTTKDCYQLSNPILELARIVCTWTSFPQTVSKIMIGSVMRGFAFHLSVFFFNLLEDRKMNTRRTARKWNETWETDLSAVRN